ncbi:MAG: J domain-containing protein, partial [Thermoanaerobaculia bacterium]
MLFGRPPCGCIESSSSKRAGPTVAKNYYDILGLPRNATTRQVRDRFRTLARELHPDRFRGQEKSEAEARFQEITQA